MLCLTQLLNGFVFSEAPTDAGLEFNQPPGENQGNGADPSFDGNRTHGTKSPVMAAGGNWRDLYLPDLPFKLCFEQIKNLSQDRRCQLHKKTTRQLHGTAPKQGSNPRETFGIISTWEDNVGRRRRNKDKTEKTHTHRKQADPGVPVLAGEAPSALFLRCNLASRVL